MKITKKLYIFLALICFSTAVKVNMRGSLHLGQKIVDVVMDYMKHKQLEARRSMTSPIDSEEVYKIVTTFGVCKGTDLCNGRLEGFLNNYIVLLTLTLQTIFLDVFEQIFYSESKGEDTKEPFFFENELKVCLSEINKTMIYINNAVEEQNTYIWLSIIKKIRILFEDAALKFAKNRIESNVGEIKKVERKLSQKIIRAMIAAEAKYENRLCAEHNVCPKSFKCTKHLSDLLILLSQASEGKRKEFIKYVYLTLAQTKFYTYLDEVTANQFQIILSDLSFTVNVSSKDVILTLNEIVQYRINSIVNKGNIPKGLNTYLIYIILSDMDYFYSKRSPVLLLTFLDKFEDWSMKEEGSLKTEVRHVINNIADTLKSQPEDMFAKVVSEVKLFLEITIDPET